MTAGFADIPGNERTKHISYSGCKHNLCIGALWEFG